MVGFSAKNKSKPKEGRLLTVKDGKITEVKPTEVKPTEVKPTEVKPTEVKPTTAPKKKIERKSSNVKEKPKENRVRFAMASESANPVAEQSSEFELPNLYEEMDENIETCLLMYPLAELRRLVVSGELNDPDGSIMRSPKSSYDMFNTIMSNAKAIDAQENNYLRGMLSAIGERVKLSAGISNDGHKSAGTVEVFYDGLKGKDEEPKPVLKDPKRQGKPRDNIDADSPSEDSGKAKATTPSASEIMTLSADGLLYSIMAYHARKRITLTLRGSVLDDFSWASATMKTVANPMGKHPEQKDTMRLHTVFYDCLFKPSSRQAKGPNGEVLTEYHDILLQVIAIMKKYPGYKLYVTGWSFGGALATIFAAVAAAELDSVLPKPVTCVSFASPLVGDNHFRELHQLLELQGKLRHIRVSNHKDLLAISPNVSASKSSTFYHLIFDEGTGVGIPFKHVGISVKLHGARDPFEISYPKIDSGMIQTFTSDVKFAWENSFFTNLSWTRTDYSKYHNIWTYSQRMARGASLLEYLYLNDLYEDKDIVGDYFARNAMGMAVDS